MDEFLRRRGVAEAVIRRLSEEKIDVAVVAAMPDEDLKRYVPAYGDRIALVTFAKCELKRADPSTDAVPNQCLTLPQGLKRKSDMGRKGNRNAYKSFRRVELGWLNRGPHGFFKQVRSNSGGGTRSLSVERTLHVTDLLPVAINTFFPEGTSRLGDRKSFDIELRDFKGESVAPDTSIEDMYNASRLKMLRFYIYTTPTSTSDIVHFPAMETPRGNQTDNPAPEGNQTDSSAPGGHQLDNPATGENQTDNPAPEGNQMDSPALGGHQLDNPATGVNQMDNPAPEMNQTDSLAPGENQSDNPVPGESPEIVFHPRHRLALSRHNSMPASASYRSRSQTVPAVVDILSEDEDDNEDFKRAIEASLLTVSDDTSKEAILSKLNSAVDPHLKRNLINVTRQDILDGAMRGFRRRTFDPRAQLHVQFGGEDGIDVGGLTREFLRLVRKALSEKAIFSGDGNSKLLVLDAQALEKGVYRTAGQMLAYMLVHRGPTPNFLHPFLYDVLSRGIGSVRAEITHVADYELRDKLEKIYASTTGDYFDAVEPLEYVVRISGNAFLMTQPERKNELIDGLCQYIVIDSAKSAYEQFADGLNTLGVLNAIKQHPDEMSSCFVYSEEVLTAEAIFQLYIPHGWSDEGSNRRQKEEQTVSWWRDFVVDVEEAGNLADLLSFLTGLDVIPILGFESEPKITFRHDVESEDPTREFPIVNTCSLELKRPILENYDKFAERFTAAMTVTTFTAC